MSLNAPNFNAVLATFLAEVQALEDAILGVVAARLIENAWGAQLDLLGAWAGIPRTDVDDDVYKAAIELRWYENRVSGTPDEVAYVAKILCAADSVRYQPAARTGFFSLLVSGGSVAAPRLAELQALAVAGVELVALRRGALRPFHCGDACGQALLHE